MAKPESKPEFKGAITTTGRSEAIRLDKALFKAHPEFRQRARVRAHVIGPGSLLVTLDPDQGEMEAGADSPEHDPVVAAYLAFLERDMRRHPEHLRAFTDTEMAELQALTQHVAATDDDTIPDDVGF